MTSGFVLPERTFTRDSRGCILRLYWFGEQPTESTAAAATAAATALASIHAFRAVCNVSSTPSRVVEDQTRKCSITYVLVVQRACTRLPHRSFPTKTNGDDDESTGQAALRAEYPGRVNHFFSRRRPVSRGPRLAANSGVGVGVDVDGDSGVVRVSLIRTTKKQ